MSTYILRRLLLILPTLLGILVINFIVVQAAPGGPVEQMIAILEGHGAGGIGEKLTGTAGTTGMSQGTSSADASYQGNRGLSPELIKEIEKLYGFDKPAHERFWLMLKNYSRFEFGDSLFRNSSVVDLIIDKLPVSLSLGLWSTLIIYLISIPLGIKKAVNHGSNFDIWTSAAIIIGYAIPGFLLAILLIVLLAGGSYLNVFPLRGLTSPGFEAMSLGEQIIDYFWHLALPITAYTIGGFATLTMMTKNSFLDEINRQYVTTARAKGLTEKRILYGHVFRNAMLIIISGFPAAFISIFFAGSLLIEVIFSLDGLGLLGFESVINRDYPVIFGTLFIFTLLGLIVKLISDLVYVLVDPRIDFETREA